MDEAGEGDEVFLRCVGAAVSQCVSSDDASSCHRVTAAEELRGHLLDCVSLYVSRFEHTSVSSACIQTIPPSSLPSPVQDAALRDAANVSETGDEVLHWADGVGDVSTAVAVLFVHAAEKPAPCTHSTHDSDARSPTTLLGVVVAFHYWRGFSCIAERPYTSAAEAQSEAAALESRRLTVFGLLSMPQWQRPHEQIMEATSSNTLCDSDAHRSPSLRSTDNLPHSLGADGATFSGSGAAFESLTALLVSRYL